MRLPYKGKSRPQYKPTARIKSASSDPLLCNNQPLHLFTQCNQVFKISTSQTTSASRPSKVTSLSSSTIQLSSTIIFNKTMFLKTNRCVLKIVLSKLIPSKFSSRRSNKSNFLVRLLKISFKLAGV